MVSPGDDDSPFAAQLFFVPGTVLVDTFDEFHS